MFKDTIPPNICCRGKQTVEGRYWPLYFAYMLSDWVANHLPALDLEIWEVEPWKGSLWEGQEPQQSR